ncbi:MAG: transglutaminase domain-containing protein [Planctomycetes bacterium]|nr:transglutaminase domain-containing protein [Planctomycetota bacterium]
MPASPTKALPRFDTLLLAMLAAGGLAVVRIEAAWHRGPVVAQILCELSAEIGLWALVRNCEAVREQGSRYLTICVALAVGFPIAWELGQRWSGQSGTANEITMLVSLQLVAMALAAFSFLPRLGGTSVLLSSFLLLFSTTMTTNRFVFAIAGVYGVLGLWWLMGAYWDRIEGVFVASSVERRIPVRASVIGVTGLVLLLFGSLVGAAGTSAVVLRGFMPTSGGNRWHDPYARSGVGDGDAMVAAKDEALSFGPVESDLFLDSEMPSLYDMFDDTYGEPPRPNKRQQKAVSLAPQDRKETEQRIAQTQRSGREFSMVRRRVERKREELSDRNAPAMLYVVGQTPLHLGLETYNFFDGREWTHVSGWEEVRSPKLDNRFGKPWIDVRRTVHASMFQGENCYAVKVINLKTNRIPAPPHLTELHIDLVDRVDFFDWTKDGMFQMSGREHIPQLTVIHLHSHGINLHPLRRGYDFSQSFTDEQLAKLSPYLQHAEQHKQTADAWVYDVPRGWLQVEAIVNRLRRDFVHDPDATAPSHCDDVVSHFLETRGGPDYLFAATAAMLLRSLKYPTRLVTGFYADPQRFDHRAGQTAVLSEDVHVWAEVCVDGRNWVTIEPTPGYQPPSENLTWKQRAMLAFAQWIDWCKQHLVSLSALAMVVAVLAASRLTWLDVIGLCVFRLLGLRSSEANLVWTIRLLEWRAWLAGRSRPRQKTIASWYSPMLDSARDELKPALRSFFRWSDHLLYSARVIESNHHDEVRSACAAVVAASRRKLLQSSITVSSSIPS